MNSNINCIADIDFQAAMGITGEDKNTIIEKTLCAWAECSDYKKRRQAAYEGGTAQWDCLVHDESVTVRAAIAEKGSERYQLALTGDKEPTVRDRLARYGSDEVRQSLLRKGEMDQAVVVTMATYGGIEIRRALVNAYWDKPEYLIRMMPYTVNSDLKRLIEHPNRDVRITAALYGSKKMCLQVLSDRNLGPMRYAVEDRVSELDHIAALLCIKGREVTEAKDKTDFDVELGGDMER